MYDSNTMCNNYFIILHLNTHTIHTKLYTISQFSSKYTTNYYYNYKHNIQKTKKMSTH